MSKTLPNNEIKKRLIRLVNLEKLHTAQLKRNERQREIIKQFKNDVIGLKIENKEKDKTIQTLKLQIEELQQMVFGKKKHKDFENKIDDEEPPKTPQKRSNESYKREQPKEGEITNRESSNINDCPECNTKLTKKKVIVWYEEDIVIPTKETNSLKTITEHTTETGYCSNCKKQHSLIPIPRAKVIFGKQIKLYICYLSILIRLSYEQIQTLLKTTYNIQISDGEIAKILEKEAIRFRPECEAIKERIRKQKGVHYDETGWKVQKNGFGNYTWGMTGTETNEAVFSCGKSRGKGNALDLQKDSKSIGISDNYPAYNNMFNKHQLCWAHVHRKLRDLAYSSTLEEKTRLHCEKVFLNFKGLYRETQVTVDKNFNTEERKQVSILLLEKFDNITIPNFKDPKKLIAIKQSLIKNRNKYFTCVFNDGIPLDNNKAERILRHLVIKRKTSFGSKTRKGAETMSILASVFLSAFWTNRDNFFEKLGEV